MLATAGAAAAQVFVRVFTKAAVTAGLTSQLDSPAPGPADVAALGILVFGLFQAGVLTIEEIQKGNPPPGTTTAPPPPPPPAVSAVATATAVPVTTTIAPPIPVPRSCRTEYPDLLVCMALPREYTYVSEGAALAAMKAGLGKKGLQFHNGSRTRGGPCPGKGMHYNVRLGGDRVGSITCCECCIEAPEGPRSSEQCRIVW